MFVILQPKIRNKLKHLVNTFSQIFVLKSEILYSIVFKIYTLQNRIIKYIYRVYFKQCCSLKNTGKICR